MNQPAPIAGLRVDELLSRIASHHVSPGAGAAGAVALALGAACAAKAVAVTLKHHPVETELQRALTIFTDVARRALVDAEHDREAFAAFMLAKNAAAADRLVCEGEDVARLIREFLAALDRVESRIAASMAGDLAAARALAGAARSIQERNEAETKGSAPAKL